jgi:IS605 OrfB family transposase
LDRVLRNISLSYSITYSAEKKNWFIRANWSKEAIPTPPLEALQSKRTLGIDLNSGHLDYSIIDQCGNIVGSPVMLELELTDLKASTRDGHLRDAISEVIRIAKANNCASISIENLNFEDARNTGRETMGRGKRGKKFRKTVSGIPTGAFKSRLASMAYEQGLYIIAVDPAYTSKWGREHWLQPLKEDFPITKQSNPISGHSAASLVIGRRALSYTARRRMNGLRSSQRIRANQPSKDLTLLLHSDRKETKNASNKSTIDMRVRSKEAVEVNFHCESRPSPLAILTSELKKSSPNNPVQRAKPGQAGQK